MPEPFYFISYSRLDGEDFALKLGDQLAAGPPSIGVWLDRRRLQPGIDWDEQLVEALARLRGFPLRHDEGQRQPKLRVQKGVDPGAEI